MFAFLLSLLTRYSFAQVVTAVAVTTAATVTIAGSADVVTTVERVIAAASDEAVAAVAADGGTGDAPANPALAVLSSPVQVSPDYTLKNVTYRLAEVPTSIGAIVFRLEAPAVLPQRITVQAVNPAGAHYRCEYETVKGDLLVTCDTKNPALPVAQINRLYVEVHG